MNTIKWLTDPELAGFYWPSIVTGLAVAALCSLLSVLVVLKRMAFIGQGISHAAFGGIGVAGVLGLLGTLQAGPTPAQSAGQFAVVLAFCLAAGLLIGWLSDRGGTEADTAIGIVLVAAMAVGAILILRARTGVSLESFLFGDILAVSWADAAIGWAVALAVLLTLILVRRPLIFWAFDPTVARALGVSDRTMNVLLMILLSLATVTAMKLAGVVLATAMLVLPGAMALRISHKSAIVLTLACIAAVLGVLGGIVVSFEFNWPTGASIVVVLSVLFAVAWAGSMARGTARA
jgi:ABC-type Mn2+/Zn2+ transport system permease subunit